MFTEAYLATITVFAGNFAPLGWRFCDGSLLAISEYDALFALIGTTYGGDGQVTFALPDFRGRVAVHAGQGQGLSNYMIGQMGGNESTTLNTGNMPAHTHAFVSLTGNPTASASGGNLNTLTGNVPAQTMGINSYNTAGTGAMQATTNNANTIPAGNSQPLGIISPVLAMNYIIAVEGIFPTRA